MQLLMKNASAFFLLAALLFSSFIVNAQQTFTVTGSVHDSIHQNALGYATVNIYKKGRLDTAIKVMYTTDKGRFSFNKLDSGSYTIIALHTGYAEKQTSFTLTNQDLDIKEILLSAASAKLGEVTVTARKPLIEQSADKIVFNVEADPVSKTQNAIDILRKTPFVSVDGDDNIQVNGQSNFKVLLNGRETAMFAQNVKEALKGFPGNLVVKIEVITSPSAKYDAEGVGGVINIITKKKVSGYNGSVNGYSSTAGWNNLNANFSLKSGKFGITAYYGAGGSANVKGRQTVETTPFTPTIFTHRRIDGERLQSNFWHYGNAELSYEIDTLHTLSAYGNVNGGFNKSLNNQSIITEFPSSDPSVSFYEVDSRYEYPSFSMGSDFIKKFSSNKEKEFSIRLNAELGTNNAFINSAQDNPAGFSDRYINNRSTAKNHQYTFQSDYILPFNENTKLESGVKAIIRRATSDFQSQVRYNLFEDFKLNPSNTDYFSYYQDIYSAYTTYHFKLKKTSLRFGARMEHTEINGDFTSSKTTVKQFYTSILPNVQSTFKLSNSTNLVLNYNMRLQRPYIWNLNPFVNNNDSLNISFGNPGLLPQTIHSLSAQTRISKGSSFAGITLTGSYSNDMIVQYASFDQSTGITKSTSGNYGEEWQLSLNTNVSIKFNEAWNMFLNGNLRYNHVTNKAMPSQQNSALGGNLNLNSSYKIGKRLTASGYGGFWRSPVTIQGTQSFQYWYGLGMGYRMFNEKLTVTLNAANFLQEYFDYIYTVNDPLFKTQYINTQPYRGIALSFTWNFGKLTENVSKKKGVNNDDLIGGGSSN